MPNHLHILLFVDHPARARWDLGVELRAWTQRFQPKLNIWSAIPEPRKVPDFHHLKRQIRYVHLNPCRAGLAADPLQWEWSTHRDIAGCAIDVWPDLPMLAKTYGAPLPQLGRVMHQHISSDPSVATTGTPMIRTPRNGEPISADMTFILLACAVARREPMILQRGKLRDLTVQTAHQLGLNPEPAKLRISKKSWNRAVQRCPDQTAIKTVLRILADPRCRGLPQ
ncbi:MAG: hypothetical protein A2X94_06620 [Bdellovibrionales bacterium GWB1_55_8]|nr:MAG: hypothetical protein A2X94_06620 [Bdellovibrionales bacterium GWB1_55_8]